MKGCSKGEHLYLHITRGNVNYSSRCGSFPQKPIHLAYVPALPLLDISKEFQSSKPQRYLHISVYDSTIHNSLALETI